MAVYLITGASSGIGKDIAKMSIERGHTVYGLARRKEILDKMAAELGERFIPFACDVTNKIDVEKVCSDLPSIPDIVFCNAGIGEMESRRGFDVSIHERVFAVNYFGVLYTVHGLFPKMAERGKGTFVVTSSLAGYNGLPMASAYSASKAAVSAAFQGFRLTLHKTGLRFVSVQPGFIDTPLTADAKHPLPFKWTCEKASRHILDKVEAGKTLIAFPWPIRFAVNFARFIPYWLYEWAMKV